MFSSCFVIALCIPFYVKLFIPLYLTLHYLTIWAWLALTSENISESSTLLQGNFLRDQAIFCQSPVFVCFAQAELHTVLYVSYAYTCSICKLTIYKFAFVAHLFLNMSFNCLKS